jgi:hypothetical protein
LSLLDSATKYKPIKAARNLRENQFRSGADIH